MTTAYTDSELNEFDRLTLKTSSPDQMARIEGRMGLKKFIQQHGREKCDAMFAALTAPKPKRKRTRR